MARIYSYQKIIDEYTTYTIVEPDYELLETEDRITELCTIDGLTYASVPDSMQLPTQPECIDLQEVMVTDELKAKIKAASPHVRLINQRVEAMVRERYSTGDEFKMLRLAPSDESAAYNEYAEECRAWGRGEKTKLGL